MRSRSRTQQTTECQVVVCKNKHIEDKNDEQNSEEINITDIKDNDTSLKLIKTRIKADLSL